MIQDEAQPHASRCVVCVAYDRMDLLDLACMQTVFWEAGRIMTAAGQGGYTLHTASLHGGPIQTVQGLIIDTVALTDFDDIPIHTLFVPGSSALLCSVTTATPLVAWLTLAIAQAQRVITAGSATFLLAQTGALEGKRAATHWSMSEALMHDAPQVLVDGRSLFVQHDHLWTSAGAVSGIDLALALVEADGGRDLAMQVARELVVFFKRPGGQPQFSEMLASQSEGCDAFDELHLWLAANVSRNDLSVDLLARQMHMSARNFSRLYKRKTGRTPAKTIELFRTGAARRMLEESDRNIDQIACACGFGDEERMRVTFHRHLAVSPREYRSRLSA